MENKKVTQTRAIHGGEERPNGLRALVPPIVCSTTFPFATLADARRVVERSSAADDYSRYSNPTVRTADRKLAELEGAADCAVFASGMGALSTTLLALVNAGQHIVLGADCYRPAEQLVTQTLGRLGVRSTRVDATDADAVAAAIVPGETRVVFVESPSNPLNRVADIPKLAAICRANRGTLLVVDSTFATPFNQRALELGAHLSVQSATKFLAGHNDVLAGAVSGREGLIEAIRELRGRLGATMDPHGAYLLNRGMKTFSLRMERHNQSALAIARHLEAHPSVTRVWYAGLPSHPDHAVAREQLGGFGGVVSFEIDGGYEAVERLCDGCSQFQIAASLGGVESLLHPPALFSYWDMDASERQSRGIPDGLVRLAIGLEDVDDLIADLDRGLARAQAG